MNRSITGWHLSKRSGNRKVGSNAAVTTAAPESCPKTCPLLIAGVCYAMYGKLALWWTKRMQAFALTWPEFVAAIRALPSDRAIRINQAGDLPATHGGRLLAQKCRQLADACADRMAWSYTHHLPTRTNQNIVRDMIERGLTVNLSANNPAEAIQYSRFNLPTVTAAPEDFQPQTIDGTRFVLCPAQISDRVSCSGGTVNGHKTVACGGCKGNLCSRADRDYVIAFRVHGGGKRKYEEKKA